MKNHDLNELAQKLKAQVVGDVQVDAFTRGRYATDASIYQIMPTAVVIPRDVDDISATLSIAKELGVPITPRGGGTSQCGQTVNRGIIVDNSRHLNKLLELDVENRTCRVEPGIVLDELNRLLKPHGLWYPVDVSTASRATIGGMTANNSCGQRSIYYGTMRQNVLSIDAILASGSTMRFDEVSAQLTGVTGEKRRLAESLFALGEQEATNIAERFPKVLRRVGGYNVDALAPNGATHNLAHLLVGSEGTLAYSTAIELKLWPLPGQRVWVCVISQASIRPWMLHNIWWSWVPMP